MSPYWTIPRLWPGSVVYVLGGGPSFDEEQRQHVVRSLSEIKATEPNLARVIGVNDAYQLGSVVDLCWFGDYSWFEHHQMALRKFRGIIASCHQKTTRIRDVFTVRNTPSGISRDPTAVCWNKNSGASALNLAILLGARRVVLLGFDMKRINQEHNWHPNPFHPSESHFATYLDNFKAIRRDLDQYLPDVEVINATPGSALTQFPIMTFDQAVELP